MGLLLQEEDFLQRVALTLHSGYWKSKLKFNLFYLYCVMHCNAEARTNTVTCTATKRKMWVHFTWIHCCSQVQSWPTPNFFIFCLKNKKQVYWNTCKHKRRCSRWSKNIWNEGYASIKTINLFLLNIKNSFEFPPLWITFTLCFFCFYANTLYIVWTLNLFFFLLHMSRINFNIRKRSSE